MVEKYLGPARPFQCAKSEGMAHSVNNVVDVEALSTDATDGITTIVGNLRCSSKGTLYNCYGQFRRSTCVAGSTNDFEGSPSARDAVDLGETAKGSYEALAVLLDEQVPEPNPRHQHFVLRSGKFCEGLERRSASTSSVLGNESDGLRSALTGATDAAEETRAAPRQSTCLGAEDLNRLLDLLALPTASPRCRRCEALVDYSKSILLMSEQYIETMEPKAKKKEDALIKAAH